MKTLRKLWYARIRPSQALQKQWYTSFWLEKNSGTQMHASIKIVQNHGTQNWHCILDDFYRGMHLRTTIFLEPETCVPLFFSTEILVCTMMAMPSFGHPFHRQFLQRRSLLDRENKWFWDHQFSRLFAILKIDFWTLLHFFDISMFQSDLGRGKPFF